MNNKFRAAFFLCVLCLSAVFSASASYGAEISLSSLFQKRSWDAMNEVYSSKKNLSAQDHSLMANALRIQNKWATASAILEKHSGSFPKELRPYADMTLLLGYEELGKNSEALRLAAKLEKNAPEELRYYVAYAQLRLLGESDPAGSKKALSRMLETADSKERKIAALTRMIKLPGDQSANALKLLEQQPANKAAYDILSKRQKPWPAAVNLALGEYAYLKGDNKTAAALLGAVSQKDAGWRKAVYYRAYALYRSKRYAEALRLWGSLALSGNAYAESSVRRVVTLAGKAEKNEAAATLRKIVKERKGKVQAAALYALADLTGGAEAKQIEDRLIKAYPDSVNTVRTLWKRGWDAWSAKKFSQALNHWQSAYSPGLNSSWAPRVLYWIGAAQKALGRAKDAEKTYSGLVRSYPLSYYAFLANPRALELLDGEPPALASKPSMLEQWGFVYYAKLNMQRPKATGKELYRSMALSEWLGEDGGSYAQALTLSRYFVSGVTAYRKGLEYLYPRPFMKQVEAASEKYGVESNFVWAVMRQESAFKPGVTSHAGASGLMQLMPGTAKDEAKRMGLEKYDVYDAGDNVNMGASHLAHLAKSFARNDWIMAAYNAGPGNARKWLADGKQKMSADLWIEQVRFNETCDYVQKVSGNLELYRLLYGANASAGD